MEKSYYITKEEFTTVKATWKAETCHSARDHIIYNILRSKPADYGFEVKKSNIQGNDPWFAYNQALRDAKGFVNSKNPYPETSTSHLRWNENDAGRKSAFKVLFGIDRPEDILSMLGDYK